MRKILITGASGAGTTTLGRALAARLTLAFFDADDYFWLPTTPPYQKPVERTLRLEAILAKLRAHSEWVLSGSVVNWGETLEDMFTLIVFRTVPKELRLARLVGREIARSGAPKPEFIEWATRYDEGDLQVRSRALHEKWLSERKCAILRVDGDLAVDECVAQIVAASPNDTVERTL